MRKPEPNPLEAMLNEPLIAGVIAIILAGLYFGPMFCENEESRFSSDEEMEAHIKQETERILIEEVYTKAGIRIEFGDTLTDTIHIVNGICHGCSDDMYQTNGYNEGNLISSYSLKGKSFKVFENVNYCFQPTRSFSVNNQKDTFYLKNDWIVGNGVNSNQKVISDSVQLFGWLLKRPISSLNGNKKDSIVCLLVEKVSDSTLNFLVSRLVFYEGKRTLGARIKFQGSLRNVDYIFDTLNGKPKQINGVLFEEK